MRGISRESEKVSNPTYNQINFQKEKMRRRSRLRRRRKRRSREVYAGNRCTSRRFENEKPTTLVWC